jgi:NhaP-type Na+/H+ and K+/H+ antiporter
MQNPQLTLTLGLVALIAAGALTFAQRHGVLQLNDALLGLAYGIAIGLLLLSMWQRTHPQR